jgi:hypothetical protein
MSIKGHVYRVTQPDAFFGPILLGSPFPVAGYAPVGGCKVSLVYAMPVPLIGILYNYASVATTNSDGSYEMPDPPAAFRQEMVALRVELNGTTVYREPGHAKRWISAAF